MNMNKYIQPNIPKMENDIICAKVNGSSKSDIGDVSFSEIHQKDVSIAISSHSCNQDYVMNEPQSLHLLLQSEFPDLYHLAFGSPNSSNGSRPHTPEIIFGNRCDSGQNLVNACKSVERTPDTDVCSAHAEKIDSTSGKISCPDWVRRLFNGADRVYRRHVARLRAEVHDLTRQLRCLQTNCDVGNKELHRIRKERNQLRADISVQTMRYEEHLSELQNVITELRQRLETVESCHQCKIPPCKDVQEAYSPTNDQHSTANVIYNRNLSNRTTIGELDTLPRGAAEPKTSIHFRNAFERMPTVLKNPGRMNYYPCRSKEKGGSINHSASCGGCDTIENHAHEQCIHGAINSFPTEKESIDGGPHWEQVNSVLAISSTPSSSKVNQNGRLTAEACFKRENSTENASRTFELKKESGTTVDLVQNGYSSQHDTVAETNIYDLPEPEWLCEALKDYPEWIKVHDRGSSHQGKAYPGSSTSLDHMWMDGTIDGPLAPNAVQDFLTRLVELAPYPRLVDVAHYASLTWSRLLATLGRLQADCIVLHTNLVESKSTADRMHCQLNQIEANWNASVRATFLADACLELSACLNQLYTTELAILIKQRYPKAFRSKGRFPSHSSSTSSSSLNGRQELAPPSQTNPVPVSVVPGQNQNHTYALYAAGWERCDMNGTHTSNPVHLNLAALKTNRYQAEQFARSILDRYDNLELLQETNFPTNSTSIGCSHRIQQASITNYKGGFINVPSAHSLTNSSLYANSCYVSLGRNLRTVPTVEQQSAAFAQYKVSNPVKNVMKSAAPHNTLGGGWQTPDSGAGSSTTTNDLLHQPATLHSILGLPHCWPLNDEYLENSPFSNVLDALPSCQMHNSHRSQHHFICGSDSDSSDSSDGHIQPKTVQQEPTVEQTSWTRSQERKLRTILQQLSQTRHLILSTMLDKFPYLSGAGADSGGETSELVKVNDAWMSSAHNTDGSILGNLPLNLLQENALIMQEIYSVKENNAELNSKVYLLEKELQANRIALACRMTGENALRVHLEALMAEKSQKSPDQMTKDPSKPKNTSSESNLVRNQVENLLEALQYVRRSTELQQAQNEELVNDLKRANTALIEAFEKAKKKYTTRIRKLEEQLISHSRRTSDKSTSSLEAGLNPTRLTKVTPFPGHNSVSEVHGCGSSTNYSGVEYHRMPASRPLPAVPLTDSAEHEISNQIPFRR